MYKYSWVVNVLCIGGMVALFWSVDSGPDTACNAGEQRSCTVTALPVVKTPIVLADGMYGQYNENVAEQCAEAAMALGSKHKLPPQAIDGLFNECVFDQGITI